MQAVRFVGVGHPAQIQETPKPSPGPGQVLITIGGAGVCHSDLHVMEEDLGFKPPFTLGHENAGWVAALGQGVMGFKEGDAVAVYGPWGCGRCHACQLSMENYCENWAQMDGFGGGLGRDGGMAEYMLVPSARLLVSLGGLSPAQAAPLSDAALTPYHAIKRALPQINSESTVVVVGVGGLGHMAIQLLRVLAPVRIVAADVDDDKRGRHDFRHGSTPYGTSLSIPYWGSRVELLEVIAMARAGRIHAETTEFPLTDAVDVYARLKAGQITGRAVLIPG